MACSLQAVAYNRVADGETEEGQTDGNQDDIEHGNSFRDVCGPEMPRSGV
jgi:hypothetical protein